MEWEEQEAGNFRSPGFFFITEEISIFNLCHTDSALCDLGQVTPPLGASVSSYTKWGQYVIYLPQRGGMKMKKTDLQIFALGFQEGATSEPLNRWDARKSVNNPLTMYKAHVSITRMSTQHPSSHWGGCPTS